MSTLTIITPCSRPENLSFIYDTIRITKVDKWIIVYDTTNTGGNFEKRFNRPNIIEVGHVSPPETGSGNSQRNVGLNMVRTGMVYFLDDDNVIHPEFWKIAETLDDVHFYMWDQQRNDEFANKSGGILAGDNPRLRDINTAQFAVPRYMCRPLQEDAFNAPSLFIADIYTRFKNLQIYVPVVAAFYNFLRFHSVEESFEYRGLTGFADLGLEPKSSKIDGDTVGNHTQSENPPPNREDC
jgi:glycosyltransferase involved in cell wall biosynthesis